MTKTKPPPDTGKEPRPDAADPNEFTAVAPEFSGRVTNRPTPPGTEVEHFNQADDAERQEDA